MRRETCDVVILGSGFAGSLTALIARRIGLDVMLVERGRHPRFAIGESSTPLANLKLAALADAYDLPWLKPLTKYGSWKREYPRLACGLKRGFSFFHHQGGKPFRPREDHANELFVAANPDAERGDTHWYRADFDAFIVGKVVESGIRYIDRCQIRSILSDNGWHLSGSTEDGEIAIDASFVVDATGDGRAIAKAAGVEIHDDRVLTQTRALYSHFQDVAPWPEVLAARGRDRADYLFDPDASAMHHIIEGGWMWVLRFDNGITSAGFSLDPARHRASSYATPDDEWRTLMNAYPSIRRQFVKAKPVFPLVSTGRLQRRLAKAAGENWAALPHAACFIDPFLSPGIAQSLYGVERLGRIFAEHWTSPEREKRLADYSGAVLRESRRADRILSACFAAFDRFDVMTYTSMLYFAAAIYSEERHRAGLATPAEEFLLAHDDAFAGAVAKVCKASAHANTDKLDAFIAQVRKLIAPYNTCGLCDPEKRNLYPFVSTSASPAL